ncbi:MAG: dimethylsulfonioproprionate lyase family protein [Betaproteobacteria bacterium]
MRIASGRRVVPRGLPVLEWIGVLEQGAVPTTRALVRMLVAGARSLAWAQTYTPDDFGAFFLERYAWTELIGLRGPVASSRIAAGFLLLGPGLEYPLHSHEAEEMYFPLAGAAKWKRDDGDWIRKAPGTLIHHAAWVPHAMRTEREPLLALYVWRGGNLAQKSKIL